MSDNRTATKLTKLTKVDKAAILLLSLGETDAAQVLRHLGPKEVQRVGVAMAGMRNIHREQVEQVMGEFVEIVGDQTSLGGPQSIMLPSPSEGYDAQLNAIKSLVAEDPGRVAQVVKEWINADE